jgi:hypothetical protein
MGNAYCSTKIVSLPGNGTAALTNFLSSQHETIIPVLATICFPSYLEIFRAEGCVTMSTQQLQRDAQRIIDHAIVYPKYSGPTL